MLSKTGMDASRGLEGGMGKKPGAAAPGVLSERELDGGFWPVRLRSQSDLETLRVERCCSCGGCWGWRKGGDESLGLSRGPSCR